MAKRTKLGFSPVRSIMKSVGAGVVQRDAVTFLIKHLIETAENLTTSALKLTRHRKKTKIMKADIEMAIAMG